MAAPGGGAERGSVISGFARLWLDQDETESRSDYVHATWTGCEGWDENLWAELAGSCEALLEMAGAKHVGLRVIKGGRTGDDACEMEAHWV
jgi:hypothetical protein